MKKLLIITSILISAALAHTAHALTKPVVGISVLAKCGNIMAPCSGTTIFTTTTDQNGAFKFSGVSNPGKTFTIYVGEGENTALGTISGDRDVISGRVMLDLDDTAPTTASVLNSVTSATIQNQWTPEKIARLKTLLALYSPTLGTTDITQIDQATIRLAIKKFQAHYGITQTGTIGPLTMKKINDLLK